MGLYARESYGLNHFLLTITYCTFFLLERVKTTSTVLFLAILWVMIVLKTPFILISGLKQAAAEVFVAREQPEFISM